MGVFFSPAHTSLVDRDLDQPGAEPRLCPELAYVLERFQHSFLSGVLGIRFIAQYGKSRPVHIALVRENELIKKIMLSVPNAPDQRRFVELSCWIVQRSRRFRHHSSW